MMFVTRIAPTRQIASAIRDRTISRQVTTSTASVPKPRSEFELEEAPLFSLRTRIIFFSVVGSLAAASVASYWLNSDRENAYRAEEAFPSAISMLGPYLGLPIDPKLGKIDREALGPRDVRDMVGDRVTIEMTLRSGVHFTTEANSLESLSVVMNRNLSGVEDQVVEDSIVAIPKLIDEKIQILRFLLRILFYSALQSISEGYKDPGSHCGSVLPAVHALQEYDKQFPAQRNTMDEYTREHGKLHSTGACFEFYLPKHVSSSNQVGAVLLMHGFQCKLDYHRGTAALLARNNVACLLVNMLPLMGFVKETLHSLRENNVQATIKYVEWLSQRPEVDWARIILAGYSAGGAVALESASALAGNGKIRAVLLLDAVPWISTLDRGATAEGLVAPHPSKVDGSHGGNCCLVASLRGETSAYNAHNMILEQLARGIRKCKASYDIKVISAHHGDFMCSSEEDLSIGVGGLMGWIMQSVGLFSNRRVRASIQALILAFVLSALGINPKLFSATVSELELQKILVVVGEVDDSLPSMRNNFPHFLQ